MSVRTHLPTPILKYGRGTLLRFIDKLKRQVKEQGEKIELLEREISVLQNEKKSFFGFKRR